MIMYSIDMEDMGEGGFDTERTICHVTWLPKQQAFLVAINTKHSSFNHVYNSDTHLRAFASSVNLGVLIRTEGS